MQEVKLQSIGLYGFKDLYEDDIDFLEAHKLCTNFSNHFHSEFAKWVVFQRTKIVHTKEIYEGKFHTREVQWKHEWELWS